VRMLNEPERGSGEPSSERITPAYASPENKLPTWPFGRRCKAPGPDPCAPIMRWEQSPIAIYIDFEFSFQVIHGKGVVHTR